MEHHKKSEISKRQALILELSKADATKVCAKKVPMLSAEWTSTALASVVVEKEDMSKAVEWCNKILPKEKPRHLLGIGEPVDLFGAVENGCDLFDCVSPTRVGRNGNVYTTGGRVNITNAEFREDSKPIDDGCGCYTCQNFSRAYVAHLFRANEMLAGTLASIHNLYFIVHMVDKMRETMASGGF